MMKLIFTVVFFYGTDTYECFFCGFEKVPCDSQAGSSKLHTLRGHSIVAPSPRDMPCPLQWDRDTARRCRQPSGEQHKHSQWGVGAVFVQSCDYVLPDGTSDCGTDDNSHGADGLSDIGTDTQL